MALTRPALKLTQDAALALVQAAAEAATAMGVPQCIAVVDEGCNLLAFLRMDGARVLSIDSARRKAETAAAMGKPSGAMHAEVEIKLAIASDGRMTNLKGGMPIIVEGQVVGGIGIGSGTGDQDREIAAAAIARVFG
ncbi:heme-binding protein [Falsiroseomonas sp.]|uniref:GlcG/HbpS family heme-binding protein n=1 Tax=Falsiroseomonas sp. TaxID=2870721 RepID=UPI002718E174|nr:heme-binding protein [Falsiroseomonas sp.]MDO9498956.1 heme-binding protein [Falsiroseomonas sp.]MDP3414957.1 heme-binding protein [Falsiroseomonas sp.]